MPIAKINLLCLNLLLFALPKTLPARSNSSQDPLPTRIDYQANRSERLVWAVRTREVITLDGRLDETAWELASPATDFIQWQPNPGAPATERTEVRFIYDADNLYVGAFAYDTQPDRLIVNELKEDFQGQDNDGILLIFDTLNDRRSGFVFTTNPAGAKRDFQAANDGESMNMSWDGVWEVQTSTNEKGWIAEFVIPFKTLRFSDVKIHEWGLNIVRRVRRKTEDSYWAPVPWPYRGNKVSMAGTLKGIENIQQGRNFKVKPFTTAGMKQVRSKDKLIRDLDYDGGVDIKYGITSQLTLDLTYRTDFAQVEVDQQQLNLTRFSLFFPEKREFFLENSGTFDFGRPIPLFGASGRGRTTNNLIPFFSRRIGLGPNGSPIPIVGGARVSGTMGSYDLGFLTMKTASQATIPTNNFTVARVKKNLIRNSWIGMLVTNRESSKRNDHNRVYGADARFRLFRNLEVSSYLMRSDTPGLSGNNQARHFESGWRSDTLSVGALYHEVQKNFNPEMGFIRRTDTTRYSGSISWRPRLEASPSIRNLGLGSSQNYYTDGNGGIETREHNLNLGLFFQNSSALTFEASDRFERLDRPFRITRNLSILSGDYHFRSYSTSFQSNKGNVVSGDFQYDWGNFWNGSRKSFKGGLLIKPNYHLNIDLNYTRNDVKLPNGSFISNLVATRFLYAFTNKMFLNAFLQYNTDTNQFSSNIRFNIIHHPLSDLFIVYTETRNTVSGQLLGRAFFVKFTQLFNF